MADRDQKNEEEMALSLVDLIDVNASAIGAYAGFGFFISWIWLGLYEGYPVFQDGNVDNFSVAALLLSFTFCILCFGYIDKIFACLLSWNALICGAVIATVGSGAALFLQSGIITLDYTAYISLIRLCSSLIGAGTALLLEYYGLFFSRLEPVAALLAFCLSFIAVFFSFFWVSSSHYPLSCVLFSTFPVVCALALKPSLDDITEYARFADSRRAQHARGFTRMLIAFGVFTFSAALTQSFEPLKDFALSVDEGVIGFSIVLVVVSCLVLSKGHTVGTFKILKVLYQASVIMLVLKLVLQPLAADDSYFAALNVLEYLALFMVFWLLAAFVGYVNDTQPAKVFALAFGVASICMACGWILGTHLNSLFGHDRYFISIAAGCAVAVFCTFGFSTKDFPYLMISGKGVEKLSRKTKNGDETDKAVTVTTDMVVESLSKEHRLTARENEILALLARGLTTDSIASKLTISYYTVRTHIRNIYVKLDVGSRSDLFLLMIQREKELAKAKPRDE